jgi:hypothetical protein
MTEQEIHDLCVKYGISNYSINLDGSIDVNGNVNLYNRGLSKIPLKFNRVDGYFDVNNNKLTSLENSPLELGKFFYCYKNPLESLDGYNLPYNKLLMEDKDRLVLKLKRSKKLKILDIL